MQYTSITLGKHFSPSLWMMLILLEIVFGMEKHILWSMGIAEVTDWMMVVLPVWDKNMVFHPFSLLVTGQNEV